MHYLKQLPVQLIISILLAFGLGSLLDLFYVSLFYSISTVFIQILIFILPFMVFSFIFRALANSQRGSLSLLLLIFAGVTLSSTIALTTSNVLGQLVLPFLGLTHSPDFISKFTSQVTPLFAINLPPLVGTEKAMLSGIFLGIAVSFLNERNAFKIRLQQFSIRFSDSITLFLKRVFIPLLPLYVFGFCLKLSYDQALLHLFQQFGKVFLFSMTLLISYMFLLYFIGSGANFARTRQNLKLMTPAGLTAFSTMSSAATMPVTLTCAYETTKDRDYTDLIIPSTTNIHMLGDALTIMITALTLLSIFGMPWPGFETFLPFAMAYSLATLSCVGAPGASVLVVLPVLQNHLGFTPEMISILTTIYILQDSFGTTGNVLGNGAFALIIQRIRNRIKQTTPAYALAESETKLP
ncbi:MAG: cation:dicarboxylase symporter family transporter [Parachlamydiaceae bacterium]|nr:cation:dicarboxylase symporter family transporter [Parachlamydiaceae bacterium]